MEVAFGSGVSGAIGKASQQSSEINQTARGIISAFNRDVLSFLDQLALKK
jgi:hypothetical protein